MQNPIKSVDILRLCDFSRSIDGLWQVANETEIEASAGYRTGLLHAGATAPKRIHTLVRELLRTGRAVAIDPCLREISTKLLIVHDPLAICNQVYDGIGFARQRILASSVVAMAPGDATPDQLRRSDSLLSSLFGSRLTWAAPEEECLKMLSAAPGLAVADELWRPSLTVLPDAPPRRLHDAAMVIGMFGSPASSARKALSILQARSGILLRLMDAAQGGRKAAPSPVWEVVDGSELHPDKFLDGLDLLLCPPGVKVAEAPLHLLARALGRGVPVAAPLQLEAALGAGPVYFVDSEFLETVSAIIKNPDQPRASVRTLRSARRRFTPAIHLARIHRVCGAPQHSPPRARRAPRAKARALFIVSEHGGVGETARLLAIARRLPQPITPVFACLNRSFALLDAAGYTAEYISPPPAGRAQGSKDWACWLDREIGRILTFHSVLVVVLDGERPPAAVIQAIARRADTKLVWVRRPRARDHLGGPAQGIRPYCFDLIIEAGDLATNGVPSPAPSLRVPPIRLLERDEELPRESAAFRLGLDPDRPAVLLLPPSDETPCQIAAISAIIDALSARKHVQLAIADDPLAYRAPGRWPDTPRLRVFPIAKFFGAFDLVVSPADYNKLHDIVAFGATSLLLSTIDGLGAQRRRALRADEAGAALHLVGSDPGSVETALERVLNDGARRRVQAACYRLAQPNGAPAAAQAIAALAGQRRVHLMTVRKGPPGKREPDQQGPGAKSMFLDCEDLNAFIAANRDRGRELWVFHHIPKTAGTSLHEAVVRRVRPFYNVYITPDIETLPDRIFAEKMDFAVDRFLQQQRTVTYRWATGHFERKHIEALRMLPNARLLTFLRDPFARLVSDYRYQQTPAHPYAQDFILRFPTFESFLSAEDNRNVVTRYLTGCAESVDEAIHLLRTRYAFVGLYEMLPLCFAVLCRLLGLDRPPALQHLNRAVDVVPNEVSEADETIAFAQACNPHDYAIYAFVRERLVTRLAEVETLLSPGSADSELITWSGQSRLRQP